MKARYRGVCIHIFLPHSQVFFIFVPVVFTTKLAKTCRSRPPSQNGPTTVVRPVQAKSRFPLPHSRNVRQQAAGSA